MKIPVKESIFSLYSVSFLSSTDFMHCLIRKKVNCHEDNDVSLQNSNVTVPMSFQAKITYEEGTKWKQVPIPLPSVSL